MTAACTGPRTVPVERSIGLGFEDVTADAERWDELGPRVASSGANAVSLAVGRVDWTAFLWDAHPGAAAGAVGSEGRDLVAESIERVTSLLGDDVGLTLVIDALAPRLLAESPELAGVSSSGVRNESFPSVSALERGEVGERIVSLAEDLVLRYAPDRIGLTELMFDASTFGTQDLVSYREAMGAKDWPRNADGTIDEEHESLGTWRSGALTSLLTRIKAAVAPHGIAVDVDVRAPQGDPEGDRPLSGHDYGTLLSAADRIVVWNYFGLRADPPESGGELTASLQRRFPGRYVMSTGLWGEDEPISADALAAGLAAVTEAGAAAVAVTPASLLELGHWRALEQAWTDR